MNENSHETSDNQMFFHSFHVKLYIFHFENSSLLFADSAEKIGNTTYGISNLSLQPKETKWQNQLIVLSG